MSDFLKLAQRAARSGGQVLLDWRGRFETREKGPADLVTQADLASQEAIRDVVLAANPSHGFVGEESEAPLNPSAEYRWVVDPLDGTTNYVHQVPHFAVSIALIHGDRPMVGVIFDPTHDEMFSALAGQGATRNGRELHTSSVTHISEALVAASFSAKVPADSPEIDQFVAVLLNCQAVRRTGSAALNLAYVAAGRFDAFWAMTTHAWDVAAGVLMVEEAGGIVTALDGGPFDLKKPHPLASCNRELHDQVQAAIQNPSRYRTGTRFGS